MEAENKKLDQFTKDVLQGAGLSSPSTDFLANVMAEVSSEKATSKVYKPFISKVGWFVIGGLFLLFAYVLTNFSLGFSILGDWDLSSLLLEKYQLKFEIPATYAYGCFFLLVFVQTIILLPLLPFRALFTVTALAIYTCLTLISVCHLILQLLLKSLTLNCSTLTPCFKYFLH